MATAKETGAADRRNTKEQLGSPPEGGGSAAQAQLKLPHLSWSRKKNLGCSERKGIGLALGGRGREEKTPLSSAGIFDDGTKREERKRNGTPRTSIKGKKKRPTTHQGEHYDQALAKQKEQESRGKRKCEA